MTDDEKIADMLLSWEEVRERGETIAAEELCRDRPELLAALRECIRLLGNAGWMHQPTAAAPDKPRTLAERYALEQLIGSGGYAQVWRAYDLQLHRHVAVKVPKPSRTLTNEQADEVLTEARQIARLKHPNIVTVHDVVREGAGYFIVTDLIEGQTLAERLEQGRMPVAEVVTLLAQAARAIDYAHAQGVIHRDLKPANIFLDSAGQPHVGDFGLARSREDMIEGSDRRGTLAYSSPEQLEGRPLDSRSDIWSLGVILYEMLAGRQPFADDNPVRLRQTILAATIPDVPAVPAALMAVCRRCLTVNPDGRFPSANQLARALTDGLASWRIRQFRRFAVIVGTAVLLGMTGLFLLKGQVTERESPNSIYIGTRQAASNWRVTGAGATDSPAFPFGGLQDEISLTSNGNPSGQFLRGGSADRFDGFWMATRRFELPANAESVSLKFSNLRCDDRGVLLLNGEIIGNCAAGGFGPSSVTLSPGAEVKFNFTNITLGTIDRGFFLGGENTLVIIVNNVKGGFFGTTSAFLGPSDGTHAGVDVTIVFTRSAR